MSKGWTGTMSPLPFRVCPTRGSSDNPFLEAVLGLSPSIIIIIIIVFITIIITTITIAIYYYYYYLLLITIFTRKMFSRCRRPSPVMEELTGVVFARALGWRRAAGLTCPGKCNGARVILCSKVPLVLSVPPFPPGLLRVYWPWCCPGCLSPFSASRLADCAGGSLPFNPSQKWTRIHPQCN